jgi:hypothetical protein
LQPLQNLCCTINPKKASIISISTLEQRVLQYYPDEAKNFYFIVHGKPLDQGNCHSMVWTNGSTIFVQYRKRGGCFVVSFTILTVIIAALIGSFCTCGMSLLVIPVLLPFLFVLPLFCL